ncbi:hypothetical protein [Microbacterium sp. Marseille-Q6648]|uniref:hypothetical protein n=1 Tax=Microbacterium sp. Marseille-Q6648 TaxID=2937991 RepID=UPI002042309C|nr:hypothetical protein [Microbacterium sp. Marseille-Q6648]
MGFLDRLFGTEPERTPPPVPQNAPRHPQGGAQPVSTQPPQSEDEAAIERYRYLLRTAPPETIEQVHAEAFGKLTEPQRQQVLAELSAGLPAAEQPRSSDPQSMARAATRAEYMNPGFMERTLGPRRDGPQGGPSFGAMVGSSLLGTVAGYVIGSALVGAFLAPAFADGGSGAEDAGSADAGADDPSAGGADASGDAGGWGDGGWGDAGAADAGGFGDVGDFGF